MMIEALDATAPTTITNLDAAKKQLATAIRLFFARDDAVSIHTLASAAREIFEKHCVQAGVKRTFDYVRDENPQYTEKQLWNILNTPRNFFKHATGDPNKTLTFDNDTNMLTIFCACHDCAQFCGHAQPLEVQTYSTWFLATQMPNDNSQNALPEDVEQAAHIQHTLDKIFPSIRSAPRESQMQFGARLPQAVLAGNFP